MVPALCLQLSKCRGFNKMIEAAKSTTGNRLPDFKPAHIYKNRY